MRCVILARFKEAISFSENIEPSIIHSDLVRTVKFKDAILYGYSTVGQIQNIGKPVILPEAYVKLNDDEEVHLVNHGAECLRPANLFCNRWNDYMH